MKRINANIYNFLLNNDIDDTPDLNEFHLLDDNTNLLSHYNSYLSNILNPNSPGPIEKHPYIDLYSDDFDLKRKILIIGTFPPSSYLNNYNIINLNNPNIQSNLPTNYFYGNMNSLWNYLFNLNIQNYEVDKIRYLLSMKNIAITDVFKNIQRKNMVSPNDDDLFNIKINENVKNVFHLDSKIETIFTTSGSLSSLLNSNSVTTTNGLFWILDQCFENGLNEFQISGSLSGEGDFYNFNDLGIQNSIIQQNRHIVWWIKKDSKKIKIVNLPSPSGNSSRSIPRTQFYKMWVEHIARENNLPGVTSPLKNYTTIYSQIFTNTPTIFFRKYVYELAMINELDFI